MMNKSDIKKLAAKIWHQQRGMRSYNIMHPERDWIIGVLLTIVFITLIAVWSTIVYQRNRSAINDDNNVTVENPVVYRASMVEEALAVFAKREVTVDQILKESNPVTIEETATTTDEETTATSTATSSEPEIETVTETESTIEDPLVTPPADIPTMSF